MKHRLVIALALLSLLESAVHAQTLTDFGYLHFSAAWGPTPRAAPAGARYCLVVLIDNANNGTFALSNAWYQSNIFDPLTAHSVNSGLIENSCSRFQIIPANIGVGNGVLGPLTLNANEAAQFAAHTSAGLDGTAAMSAAVRAGFPLASYDLNGDGIISPDELVLVVVSNMDRGGRGQTGQISYTLSGQGGKTCTSQASSVPESTVLSRLSTVTHEVCHNVGNMWDLYYYPTTYQGDPNYYLNSGITLASDTGEQHLDPWHKMTFGWNEPRIVSLRQGGLFFIPAAQNGDPTAPLLLYDPQRGTGEYFLLEYRTKHRSRGAGYDSGLASEGLLIWHLQQQPDHDLPHATTTPFNLTGANTIPWSGWVEGPASATPPFGPTPGAPWLGGQVTPYLRWNDGTFAVARIRTGPFQTTDAGIFVEVLADASSNMTWVDFAWPGQPFLPEIGSFDFPYNTFVEGTTNVGYAGHLLIKAGRTNATTTNLNKPMTIDAYGGAVIIGR